MLIPSSVPQHQHLFLVLFQLTSLYTHCDIFLHKRALDTVVKKKKGYRKWSSSTGLGVEQVEVQIQFQVVTSPPPPFSSVSRWGAERLVFMWRNGGSPRLRIQSCQTFSQAWSRSECSFASLRPGVGQNAALHLSGWSRTALKVDWEENPLPHWEIKAASVACWSDALPTELHSYPTPPLPKCVHSWFIQLSFCPQSFSDLTHHVSWTVNQTFTSGLMTSVSARYDHHSWLGC